MNRNFNIETSKFSFCIMNPPYDKNLHLKFLEKAISIADTVISIQPIRWLQDPFANDKKSTLNSYRHIAEKINDIEYIKSGESGFDVYMYSDLAIYTINNNDNNKLDYNNFWKISKEPEEISIIEKVCFSNKCKYLNSVIENNITNEPLVPISLIAGGRGNLPIIKNYPVIINKEINGENWIDVWNRDPKHQAFKKSSNGTILNIKFKTYNEAMNFYNSYKNLKFFYVLCDITRQQQHIQDSRLPFLDNYKHKITDEEMYKLFNLNDKEIEYIENYKK